MPTYEYNCTKCGLQFEFYQSMKDDPLSVCPKDVCQQKRWSKGKVKREIGSGAGIIFKGSGFYITDYRSDSYKEAAKNDKPPSSSDGKKSDSKKKETSSPKASSSTNSSSKE